MNTEQAKNVRERRLLAPVPVCKSVQLFDMPATGSMAIRSGFRGIILDWIADYTIGEFYLSSSVLYFCEAQDAMAYKLCDARAKADAWTALKKETAT